MAELVQLPGVGRKTANVVLGNAFGLNEGVVVDTHVGRLAGRLGLTRATDPVKIEQDLDAPLPARGLDPPLPPPHRPRPQDLQRQETPLRQLLPRRPLPVGSALA